MADPGNPPPRGGLLGAGMLYSLATVAPVIVNLLITPVVTRSLGADGYGVVGAGITVYQFGAIVLGLGLSAAITRHAIIAGSGPTGATAMVWLGSGAVVLGALVAVALLPLWAPAILGSESRSAALTWPVLSSAALGVLTLCQSVFRAINRVKTFVVLGMFSALAGPLIGVVALATMSRSPENYLAGVAAGHTLASMIGLALLPKVRVRDFSMKEFQSGLAMGLPTVPHSVTGALLTIILVAGATQIEGVAAGGRLQLALFLGSAPMLILGAFNNSWAPMVYREQPSTRQQFLTHSMQAISLLVVILVAGFCALIEPIARFIAGPQVYDETIRAAALIACTATGLMAMYLVNIHLVFLRGRTAALALTTPISGLVAVVVALAALSTWPEHPAVLAIGVPVFHGAQALWAWWLRRLTGLTPGSLKRSLPVLAIAMVLPQVTLWFSPHIWILTASGAVIVAAAGIWCLPSLRRLR